MGLPTICIDFDGVLHSYASGWQGADRIDDPPVAGAIDWLRGLIAGGQVRPAIYSSRSGQPGGVHAMQAWLVRHGLPREEVEAIAFPREKPAAFLTIDDRAICFEGVFPSAETMLAFKPWYARG